MIHTHLITVESGGDGEPFMEARINARDKNEALGIYADIKRIWQPENGFVLTLSEYGPFESTTVRRTRNTIQVDFPPKEAHDEYKNN